MEELKNNETPNESNGLRQAAPYISAFIFISLFFRLSDYFEGRLSFFIFSFCWFLLFANVQYFLGETRIERFDTKDWLKHNGVMILVILVLFNLFNLLISASESVPESVSAWFIPILITGSIVVLIGYGIYFIEKRSKP